MILHASTQILRNFLDKPDVVLYERAMRKIMRFTWMSDRTETLVTPLKQYIPDEYKIPAYKSVGTFEEVLEDRCLQFANSGKQLYLQWSGGIDSTLMIISFIKANVNKDQCTIVMNPDSIKENPQFFYDYVFPNYEIISTEKHLAIANNGITIQAEHADQIISGMMLSKIDPIWANKKANIQNLQNVCKELGFDQQAADVFIFAVLETGKNSPRPIDTIEDFSWWFNFNFRWLNAKEKYRPRLGYHNEFDTFYSSENIQRWSIQNKSPDKSLYKQTIYNFTKDKEFYSSKRKWQSMGKLFFTSKPDLILKDMTYYYSPLPKDLLETLYVSDNNFIGW